MCVCERERQRKRGKVCAPYSLFPLSIHSQKQIYNLLISKMCSHFSPLVVEPFSFLSSASANREAKFSMASRFSSLDHFWKKRLLRRCTLHILKTLLPKAVTLHHSCAAKVSECDTGFVIKNGGHLGKVTNHSSIFFFFFFFFSK